MAQSLCDHIILLQNNVTSRNVITLKKVSRTDMDNLIFRMLSHLKVICILQVFSLLVVTLMLTRLSCMFHHQGRHALCPHYLTTECNTLFPRAASSVVDLSLTSAASCGHQSQAPGRTLLPWMTLESSMSPGHQAATPAHTSWEVSSVILRRQLL